MSERLVCKPTPWFLVRAAAMLLMFGIFAAMFYKDGTRGYREKNYVYFLSVAFKQARTHFKESEDGSSPEAWRDHAAKQTVPLPADRSVLPPETPASMPWPAELQDFEKMKAANSAEETKLFNDFRAEKGLDAEVPDEPYDSQKIFEQWVVFWICLALTFTTLFVLIRIWPRKIAIDGEALYPAEGGRVPFADLIRLDLRKWDNKGLAFAWAKKPDGSERKIRIDGFVYGGFKKEQGEPAEKLIQRLRANFQGELMELVAADEEPAPATGRDLSPKGPADGGTDNP
ncbi:hypothetical protein [Luteolibacter sp. Populi]|uniref:hypothetical protein n=1 Tax=Luteolibacter sp. Populi TaxID=3230487 RepID=UPI003467BB81